MHILVGHGLHCACVKLWLKKLASPLKISICIFCFHLHGPYLVFLQPCIICYQIPQNLRGLFLKIQSNY